VKAVCHSLWIVSPLELAHELFRSIPVFVFSDDTISVEQTRVFHFTDILWRLCTFYANPTQSTDPLTHRGEMVEQFRGPVALTNRSHRLQSQVRRSQ